MRLGVAVWLAPLLALAPGVSSGQTPALDAFRELRRRLDENRETASLAASLARRLPERRPARSGGRAG
jgi:hypothetical protein